MGSKTLNLAEQALVLGQQFLQQGRDQEALEILSKLIRLGSLPAPIAEQTQVYLAEIHLRWHQPSQARRHLQVLLALQPENATYHSLMATALEEDDDADPDRARYHFHRCVEIEPEEPAYHNDYGQCLLARGEIELGLTHLEKAVELAPDEVAYLQDLALSLAHEGQFTRARRAVLQALFRNPDEGALRRLWDELRFRQAQYDQAEARRRQAPRTETEPTVLPFTAAPREPVATERQADGRVLRLDPPAAPPPPTPHRQRRRQSQ